MPKAIGKTTCHGDNTVYQEPSPCEHCFPTCTKCGCCASMHCGCFEYNHECECHKAQWIDRQLECDRCGPGRVKSAVKLAANEWRFGSTLFDGIMSKMGDFQGSYAEQIEYVHKLERQYEKKFNARCMTDDELDLLKVVQEHPAFKSKKVGSIQATFWRTFASIPVQKKFPNHLKFLEYAEKFTDRGDPISGMPFDL